MIKRDKYLTQLISAKNNGFPKVITGVRRCGKSFFFKEIYREYLLSDNVPENRIVILELADDKNSNYRDPLELGAYIREKCKDDSVKQKAIYKKQYIKSIYTKRGIEGIIICQTRNADEMQYVWKRSSNGNMTARIGKTNFIENKNCILLALAKWDAAFFYSIHANELPRAIQNLLGLLPITIRVEVVLNTINPEILVCWVPAVVFVPPTISVVIPCAVGVTWVPRAICI